MSFDEDIGALLDAFGREDPPPWARRLVEIFDRHLRQLGEQIMGNVIIDEDAFLAFVNDVKTNTTALTTAAGQITTAAGQLKTYIQTLVTNSATPISQDDLDAMAAADTALSQGVQNLTTAAGAVASQVPPTSPVTPVSPTPVSPTPVSPTPVSPTPVSPTPVSPTPVSPTPVSPTPVSPTPVSPAPAVTPVPLDPTQLPVQAGTLDPSTPVVEVPQGVVPVVVPAGATATTAGALPAAAFVTPIQS